MKFALMEHMHTRTEKVDVEDLLERFISDVQIKNSIAGSADDEIHGHVFEILRMVQKEGEMNSLKADPIFDKANCDDDNLDKDEELTGKKRKWTKKCDPGEHHYTMKFALREHMHMGLTDDWRHEPSSTLGCS